MHYIAHDAVQKMSLLSLKIVAASKIVQCMVGTYLNPLISQHAILITVQTHLNAALVFSHVCSVKIEIGGFYLLAYSTILSCYST